MDRLIFQAKCTRTILMLHKNAESVFGHLLEAPEVGGSLVLP